MSTFSGLSHVTMTVTDIERSVTWYERALRFRRIKDMSGPTWRRTLVGAGSVILGLQSHEATDSHDRFDPTRVGLDHISLACADRDALTAWVAAFEEHGITHSSISEPPNNALTCTDPDGIVIELFAPPAQ